MFCFAALSHAMLAEVIQLHTTFKLVVSISLILVVLQSLKNMHFHPRLGIITRTLGGASDDLVFFSILFVMLHVIFAYLGPSIQALQTSGLGPFNIQMPNICLSKQRVHISLKRKTRPLPGTHHT